MVNEQRALDDRQDGQQGKREDEAGEEQRAWADRYRTVSSQEEWRLKARKKREGKSSE